MRIQTTPLPLFALTSLTLLTPLLPGAASANLAPIGLSEVGAQWFDNEDLLFFVPETGDRFALALAAGDFNGDGAADLATGIPNDNGLVGSGCDDCGIVVVRYGIPREGLAGGLADTVLYQGLAGSPNPPQPGERFGAPLAAGDFNGDGYDDLAAGIPDEKFGSSTNSWGAVQVYYGSAAGIQTQGAEFLHESLEWTEVESYACGGDSFGAALTVGNFDGDAYDDLAIGAPYGCIESLAGDEEVGEVFVAHGSADGLLPLLGYGISQESAGIADDSELLDRFGDAVAAGDFNADGYADLAIGIPGEGDNGAIEIIMGSQFGLIYANSVFWEPGALGEVPEAGDRLGFSLAVGDFDGDGHADLAIGNPYEDLGASNELTDAGAITVAYGSPGWFDLSRTDNFTQGNVYGNPAYDETDDRFGWALAAGDFDGDGRSDLAVGHPGEDVININSGGVTVLMGGGFGLIDRFRFLAAGQIGIPGNSQGHQDFGRALAVGDFDGSGFSDLAIGAPYFDEAGLANVGGEAVLYGALFADGFELGSTSRWSSTSP